MKITVTTSKGTRSHEIADSWEKLSTGQYQRIVTDWDGKDLVKAFSILSGIEYTAVAASDSQEMEEALILSTRFLFTDEPVFKQFDLPKVITIRGKDIPIPSRIGRLSIAQNLHVRQKLNPERSYDELISFVTAIYLQPLVDGGLFDFGKAIGETDQEKEISLETEVKKLPIMQTYPVGFFLLSQLLGSGLDSTQRWESTVVTALRDAGLFLRRQTSNVSNHLTTWT